MKQDIYRLLNQVETDLSVYEIEKTEEKEIEEGKKRILDKLHKSIIQNSAISNRRQKSIDKKKHKRKFLPKKVCKAAVILAAALLSIGSVAYAATEGELFRELFTFMSGGEIYEKTTYSPEGEENISTVIMGTTELEGEDSGFPLSFEDGRLYFTGDGGKTDITDKISDTEPYFIDVIDEMGNTHRFNIGGRPEEGCYGYMEMIIDKDGKFRGGSGRTGHNITIEPGQVEPEWERKGREEVIKETRQR